MESLPVEGRALVVDPVCGRVLRARDATKVVVRDELRFFCSEECGRKFLLTPWRYEDEEYADRS